MGEHLVLRHQCGGGVLRHHVAGLETRIGGQHRRQLRGGPVEQPIDPALRQRRDLGDRHLQVVGREPDRLGVEQSGRHDVVAVGEHQGVVVDRIDLDRELLADVLERVPARPSTCGTQRRLYASCTRPQFLCELDQRAVLGIGAEPQCVSCATAVRPQRLHVLAGGLERASSTSVESAAAATAASHSARLSTAASTAIAVESWVPLTSASPSFASSHLRLRTGAAQRETRPGMRPASGRLPSPSHGLASPTSTSASMRERAKSPRRRPNPWSGSPGYVVLARRGALDQHRADKPEKPRASEAARQQQHRAHHAARREAPTPRGASAAG
jgi:hypothetical protein